MIGGPEGFNRREMLAGGALLALALGVPASAAQLAAKLSTGDTPSARQQALLRDVCQLVLPRTGTPGAGEVGTGAFVALALAHGLEGTRKPVAGGNPQGLPLRADGSLDRVLWLERELDRAAGGDFLKAPAAQRLKLLTALDAAAFPPGPPQANPSPWQAIKSLIVTGYYTSETGGSKELRYELIPGRWDNDIPLTPGYRAWSSDWTAVEFG